MSKFSPLFNGHQVIPLTKEDIFNVGMIMMQCGLTDQWPSYPPEIHIKPTTTIKFMSDRASPRWPPLDLRKKKHKVPPCLTSTSEYDKEGISNYMCMVQILHPTKIYRFNDWHICFLRQEGDNYMHVISICTRNFVYLQKNVEHQQLYVKIMLLLS